MTRPTIVFDLDGTLADTAPDLYGTVCWLLAQEGRSRVSFARMKSLIGDGAGPMIKGSFGDTGGVPEGADYDRLMEMFLTYYQAHLTDNSAPFAGALDAIARQKARGARIAICTNKKIGFTEKMLREWRIGHLFDAVTGADTFAFRKPDGRHLIETIRLAGGDPENAVMIGDSPTDTGAARDAGVPVIAVTFGYGNTPARDLDADRWIDSFNQLDRAVQELLPVQG
ncbi:HAD hydrolase-like protein [Minwuia sp.]|uniref:HAD hydrolase-like protein n=1 Tax=Minwuia sp. TaxID=2493630 RepID=UPI003A9420E2